MWHKHPKRQNHKRDCIASLPNSAALPSDNIMGPFGIRAVNSLRFVCSLFWLGGGGMRRIVQEKPSYGKQKWFLKSKWCF